VGGAPRFVESNAIVAVVTASAMSLRCLAEERGPLRSTYAVACVSHERELSARASAREALRTCRTRCPHVKGGKPRVVGGSTNADLTVRKLVGGGCQAERLPLEARS
jgi:hypothetical protein